MYGHCENLDRNDLRYLVMTMEWHLSAPTPEDGLAVYEGGGGEEGKIPYES